MMEGMVKALGDDKWTMAAEIIGAKGGVQAMVGVYYGFMHGVGMAYSMSGWSGGMEASLAISKLGDIACQKWHGKMGFDKSMIA